MQEGKLLLDSGEVSIRDAVKPLNDEELEVFQRYAETRNRKEVAKKTGLSSGKINSMLRRPHMRFRLAKLADEDAVHAVITRAEVVRGLYEIATSSATPAGVRVNAWVSIARILGLIVERHELHANVKHEKRVMFYLPDNQRPVKDYDAEDDPALPEGQKVN